MPRDGTLSPATTHAGTARPRVVVVGAGFGGLAVAKGLARAPVDVTVIDRRNYHLFQPLLYQVATAGLSPADIAQPIRAILGRQMNARVLMGRVVGVDAVQREVILADRRVPYDALVLATGARHAYFGRDEWEVHAPGLKKIDDATQIRARILSAFEAAESAADEAKRRRLLTFVIVGGGPTGVEMAGAIAELAKRALARDFRAIDPCAARIVLVEGGSRLLVAFPSVLSAKAAKALARMGVEVMTGHPVSHCDAEGVVVDGARIAARTVLWAAGVEASPAGKWLGAARDRAGRILVESDLTVPGHPEIFAIGDTASVTTPDGKTLPGTAPVAKQQGRHVAMVLAARAQCEKASRAFRYRHLGNLATIGRKSAVADLGRLRLSGTPAWFLWGVVHVMFLLGFRSRMSVLLHWLWAYVTFQSGARLITGAHDRS